MTNLWGFLLQTLYVSLVGGLLLLVKWLLQDKLTPRWQYGVWGVLALRILIPVQFVGKYILLPLPLWVETIKTLIEPHLSSAYTSAYLPATIKGPIPLLSAPPESVTDWLFVLYAAGVAVVLLRYVFSYLRLRRLLHTGSPAPEETERQIELVAERYQLKSCRAVVIPNLPSPMVCGVFRPVMALPAEKEIDNHVLLHELLHVKYGDALQSIVWCVFRALHWCNPLVQYFMNRIGNDMESLCDQRVLERLEGEERRNYGVSLLAMANDRYPRAPGTTSVSNGGKNISRRIQAIVRFKRYPKGMALASVCVTIMLLCGSLFGAVEQGLEMPDYGQASSKWDAARAIASVHLNPCTTAAGALDAYAKGLLFEDEYDLLIASSESHRKELEAELFKNAEENRYFTMQDRGLEVILPPNSSLDPSLAGYQTNLTPNIDHSQNEKYAICNLTEAEDGSFTAKIVFPVNMVINEADKNDGALRDCNYGGNLIWAYLAYPVRVWKENYFIVEETGTRELYLSGDAPLGSQPYIYDAGRLLQPLARYEAVGKTGTVVIGVSSVSVVNQVVLNEEPLYFFGEQANLDDRPNLSSGFGYITEDYVSTYTFGGTEEEKRQLHTVSLQISTLSEFGTLPQFSPEDAANRFLGSGSSSNGSFWSRTDILPDWNGTVTDTGGIEYRGRERKSFHPPKGFVVRVLWNGVYRETLILKEVDE